MICHIPPGNPGNSHTIEVGAPAEAAHLAHGDTVGECPPPPTTTEAQTTTTTEAVTTTTEAVTTTTEEPTTTTEEPTTTTEVPAPAVAVSYLPSGDPDFCQVVITITGFEPDQTYEVTLLHTSSFGTNPASPWMFSDVQTDASGTRRADAVHLLPGRPGECIAECRSQRAQLRIRRRDLLTPVSDPPRSGVSRVGVGTSPQAGSAPSSTRSGRIS